MCLLCAASKLITNSSDIIRHSMNAKNTVECHIVLVLHSVYGIVVYIVFHFVVYYIIQYIVYHLLRINYLATLYHRPEKIVCEL